MYCIRFSEGVRDDLKGLKTYDQRIVVDATAKQLKHDPARQTKNQKLLHNLTPPFEAVPPIWELRVGRFRVFYDLDEAQKIVYVRAVREKRFHRRTEDIL